MGVVASPVAEDSIDEFGLFDKFKNFLKHFGHDGVAFIKCMGKDVANGHCLKEIEHCGEAAVIKTTGVGYKDW